MDVTLAQLVGQRSANGKVETVHHAVDEVRLSGRRIGWLARIDSARFTPIVKLDPITTQSVVAELARLRQASGFTVCSDSGGGMPSDAQLQAAHDALAEQQIEGDE